MLNKNKEKGSKPHMERTATKTSITPLLQEYQKQANPTTQTDEQAYTTALTALAKSVVYAVLKKCIDVSQNKALIQVRQSVAKDTHTLQQIEYSNDTAYETIYNTDGEKVQRVKDKDSKQALDKLCAECFGDGLDLVNEAIIAIMIETAKAVDISGNFMETPYTVRRLKRKVWIKDSDSVDGWETVTTTPIQEVYKAVRRAIDSSRAMQTDPRNGYSYIEDYATDGESGTEEHIYKRMPKYADLGGYATDFNGACTFYTVDTETAKNTDSIITSLNLTAKQAKVLQLRQSGYGEKAIATYLGVSKQAIQKTLKQIQVKAIAIGLTQTN